MRVYMVRHGETILNQKGCYYGTSDVDLTDRGIAQAEELQKILKGITFDQVITSPLIRARRTASLVTGRDMDDMISDHRLEEQHFGIFEGMTYRKLQETYPGELALWNRDYMNYRIPGGESFLDVRRRIGDYCRELRELSDRKGTILLAAHKGTFGHMLAELLHLPPEGYWHFVFEQGCYSCVDLEDGTVIIRKLNTRERI